MTYKQLMIVGCLISSGFSNAQTILQTGDIAFLGIQSGFPATPTPKDRFAFVLLKNVEANTEIMFNDNSILGTAPLRMCRNESLAKWTATTPVNAGTVIVITESDTTAVTGKVSGSVSLSQTGDQIFGLQSNGTDTLLLAGISITDWEVNCVAACGGASNNVSCRPSPLTSTNSVTLATALNNGFCNITQFNGTPEEILAQINNPANWTLSDDEQTWTSSTWTVGVTTGIGFVSKSESRFQISPNPTSGLIKLTINQDCDKARISNALGVKVMEINTKDLHEINLSNLSSGMYFIQLVSAEGKSLGISRVVKK